MHPIGPPDPTQRAPRARDAIPARFVSVTLTDPAATIEEVLEVVRPAFDEVGATIDEIRHARPDDLPPNLTVGPAARGWYVSGLVS